MTTKRVLLIPGLILTLFILTQPVYPQVYQGKAAHRILPYSDMVRINEVSGIPTYINLSPGNEVDFKDMEIWLRKVFGLDSDYGFSFLRSFTGPSGETHYR